MPSSRGWTFIPAGTTIGGVTAPTPTIPQRALAAALDLLREAWTTALNLHMAFVKAFRFPAQWTAAHPEFGGMRLDNSLPFWSKVEKLTVHEKATVNPASADPAVHPVSQVDVALSEGLVHRLSDAKNMLNPIESDADVRAFEAAHSSPAELAATFPGGVHGNADLERDFVLRLVLRDPSIHPITGTTVRDVRVVKKLGDPAMGTFAVMLAPRNPNSFPD